MQSSRMKSHYPVGKERRCSVPLHAEEWPGSYSNQALPASEPNYSPWAGAVEVQTPGMGSGHKALHLGILGRPACASQDPLSSTAVHQTPAPRPLEAPQPHSALCLKGLITLATLYSGITGHLFLRHLAQCPQVHPCGRRQDSLPVKLTASPAPGASPLGVPTCRCPTWGEAADPAIILFDFFEDLPALFHGLLQPWFYSSLPQGRRRLPSPPGGSRCEEPTQPSHAHKGLLPGGFSALWISPGATLSAFPSHLLTSPVCLGVKKLLSSD